MGTIHYLIIQGCLLLIFFLATHFSSRHNQYIPNAIKHHEWLGK